MYIMLSDTILYFICPGILSLWRHLMKGDSVSVTECRLSQAVLDNYLCNLSRQFTE